MAVENTGLTRPGTGTSEDRDGKQAWTNPTNIQTAAGSAYITDLTAGTYSDWLRASNFGFQIPTGSTINGIVVEIQRKASAGSSLEDSVVYLVDANGDNDGDNKADTVTKWPSGIATATYGSSSDTWGSDIQPFDTSRSNFGIRLSVINTSGAACTPTVYWVKIRVYYTPQVTDYKTPVHCTSQTRSGSAVAWTNYSRAETSDNYYAEASVPTSSYTDWLRVDEFGFDTDDIPELAIVSAIDIKIERKAGITSNLSDSAIYYRAYTWIEPGTLETIQCGANQASATQWTTSDTEVVYRIMNPSSLQGILVHRDGFGVDLSVACDADAETVAYVDCISVRVHYAGEISLLVETLQDHCITGDNAATTIYGVFWRAQTFTPTVSYKATSVKLRLYKTGTVPSPATINVGIYATDVNGHPKGSALCSGTTNAEDPELPTGSPYEWRQITLGAGYQVTSGIKYAIMVSVPSGSFFKWVQWRYVYPSGYASGNLLWSGDSGGSWGDYSDWDAMFEVWGQVGGLTPGFLLMETDDFLLLEIGDKILLEVIGGNAFFRIITANLTLSSSISRLAAHPRSITSNLTLSPSITRTRGIVRTITSNLTLATTVSRVARWVRSIAPQITLSPTLSRVVTWTRTTVSNLTIDPIIIVRKVNDYIVTITTNLTVAATVSRKWAVQKAITASLTLSPAISRVVTWTRSTTSNITLATTISRARGLVRTITTNLTVSPTVSRVVAWVRATTSNITVSPTIVITAIVKILKVLVAAGNTYIVKPVEGNIYRMKTAAGNMYLFKMAAGVIYRVKNFAGQIYRMITKEG